MRKLEVPAMHLVSYFVVIDGTSGSAIVRSAPRGGPVAAGWRIHRAVVGRPVGRGGARVSCGVGIQATAPPITASSLLPHVTDTSTAQVHHPHGDRDREGGDLPALSLIL